MMGGGDQLDRLTALQALLASLLLAATASGHEYYSGQCPTLPALPAPDWTRLAGEWQAVYKELPT